MIPGPYADSTVLHARVYVCVSMYKVLCSIVTWRFMWPQLGSGTVHDKDPPQPPFVATATPSLSYSPSNQWRRSSLLHLCNFAISRIWYTWKEITVIHHCSPSTIKKSCYPFLREEFHWAFLQVSCQAILHHTRFCHEKYDVKDTGFLLLCLFCHSLCPLVGDPEFISNLFLPSWLLAVVPVDTKRKKKFFFRETPLIGVSHSCTVHGSRRKLHPLHLLIVGICHNILAALQGFMFQRMILACWCQRP